MSDENFKKQFKNNKKTYCSDQFMTIELNGMFGTPSILYCGDFEVEAYRRFKELEGTARQIVKADVTFVYVLETNMVERYKITEIIEDKEN